MYATVIFATTQKPFSTDTDATKYRDKPAHRRISTNILWHGASLYRWAAVGIGQNGTSYES